MKLTYKIPKSTLIPIGFSEKNPISSHEYWQKVCTNSPEVILITMETAKFNRILRCNHDVTYISIPKEILEQMQLEPGEVVHVKISKSHAAEDF